MTSRRRAIRRAPWTIATVVAAVLGVACGGEADVPERTERERDSLIAQSALPHASGVGAALRAQDKAAAVNATIDSIAASVP